MIELYKDDVKLQDVLNTFFSFSPTIIILLGKLAWDIVTVPKSSNELTVQRATSTFVFAAKEIKSEFMSPKKPCKFKMIGAQ